jgi:hypothetical protein
MFDFELSLAPKYQEHFVLACHIMRARGLFWVEKEGTTIG